MIGRPVLEDYWSTCPRKWLVDLSSKMIGRPVLEINWSADSRKIIGRRVFEDDLSTDPRRWLVDRSSKIIGRKKTIWDDSPHESRFANHCTWTPTFFFLSSVADIGCAVTRFSVNIPSNGYNNEKSRMFSRCIFYRHPKCSVSRALPLPKYVISHSVTSKSRMCPLIN